MSMNTRQKKNTRSHDVHGIRGNW